MMHLKYAAFLKSRLGTRGTVSIIMAGSALPLVIAVGAGVDMTRLTLAKTALQSAVDGAALAGASAYLDASNKSAAETAGSTYFKKFTQGSTASVTTVNAVAAPGTMVSAGNPKGGVSNNVTVSATATIPATFMQVAGYTTLTVTAKATAGNPASKGIQPSSGNGKTTSDAYDWNTAYIYAVPLDNAGKPIWWPLPDKSEMVMVSNNCSSVDTSYSAASTCNKYLADAQTTLKRLPSTVLQNQPIAMILMNMTQGVKVSNGANAYGGTAGNIAILSSAALAAGLPPSYYGDPDSSAAIAKKLLNNQSLPAASTSTNYKSVTDNCALQIQQIDPAITYAAPPLRGKCFSVKSSTLDTEMTNVQSGMHFANLSCAQMAGRTFLYWWNDMGGYYSDDKDYNDLAFPINCQLPNDPKAPPASVALIQ